MYSCLFYRHIYLLMYDWQKSWSLWLAGGPAPQQPAWSQLVGIVCLLSIGLFSMWGKNQESSSSNWISTRAPETFHLPIQRFVFEAPGGLPWTICISMTQFLYFATALCDKYVNELIAQNINQVLWSGHSLRQLCGNLEEKLILMLMIDTTRNGKLSRMSMIS